MYNLVLNSGVVPYAWCAGLIKPLYKNKGNPKDLDNYRVFDFFFYLIYLVRYVHIWGGTNTSTFYQDYQDNTVKP